MSAKQEAATRILLIYYLIAAPLVASMVTLAVLSIRRRGRWLLLLLGLAPGILMLYAVWQLGTLFLINNCGVGGGCGGFPEWTYASGRSATTLPLLAVVIVTAAILLLTKRGRQIR